MALTGLGTWLPVINNTAITNGVYSGTIDIASASDAVVLHVTSWTQNLAGADPALWTITLGGVDIQPSRVQTAFNAGISFSSAMFVIETPPTGAGLVLAITTGTSSRAMIAEAAIVSGQATPAVVQSGIVFNSNANVTAVSHTHASTADGNAFIVAVGLKGGTGAAGTATTGSNSLDALFETGATNTTDVSAVVGHEIISPAGTVTHGFGGWPTQRAALIWVELAVATAAPGPITGTGAGTLPLGGGGAGAVDVSGAGAGTLPLGGAGAGAVDVSGGGAGTLPLGGGGAGAVGSGPITGTGAGTLPLGGSGAGTVGSVPITGAGAGTLSLGGGGAGTVDVIGVGAVVLGIAGSGSGTGPVTSIILAGRQTKTSARAIGGRGYFRSIGGSA